MPRRENEAWPQVSLFTSHELRNYESRFTNYAARESATRMSSIHACSWHAHTSRGPARFAGSCCRASGRWTRIRALPSIAWMPESTVSRCATPFCSSAEVIMATDAPAITAFKTSSAPMHPARHGDVRADVAVDHRSPVKPQQQFARMAEREAGHDFQLIDVQVRLIEAVEEDQSRSRRKYRYGLRNLRQR